MTDELFDDDLEEEDDFFGEKKEKLVKKISKRTLSVEVPSVSKPNMSDRHVGRILAFQCIYAYSSNLDNDVDYLFEFKWNSKAKKKARIFAKEIFQLYLKYKSHLEEMIRRGETKWDFDQISQTNKVIIYLSIIQIMWMKLDKELVLDESVKLSKYFGDKDDYRFINGFLDKLSYD